MGEIVRLDRTTPQNITGKQPDKSTGTGRHGMAARGDDLYPTPRPLTLALLRHHALPNRVWEPAAGAGHMAAILAKAGHEVYCSDLVDYKFRVEGSPPIASPSDFMVADGPPFHGRDWAIVTNPPFAISGDFVRKGLQFCDEVVVLNRLQFLEGKGRADILDQHLRKVLVFLRRAPRMHRYQKNVAGQFVEWDGKKADSAMAFGFFVFKPNARDQGPATIERITWLNEDL